MDIEFDPAKDAANKAKHGLSLAIAAEIDFETAKIFVDRRVEYGEVRYLAFDRIDGNGYCMVFTYRNGAVRVISLRRAHEKEMRRHGR